MNINRIRIMMIDIKIGNTMAIIEVTMDMMSSAMLTGTFPTPAVVTDTAGRTANDLKACTDPATRIPAIIEMTGCILVTV